MSREMAMIMVVVWMMVNIMRVAPVMIVACMGVM